MRYLLLYPKKNRKPAGKQNRKPAGKQNKKPADKKTGTGGRASEVAAISDRTELAIGRGWTQIERIKGSCG